MKDFQLDYEANVDSKTTNENKFKEEIIQLKEQIKGKDQAISALG